jgi:hypothetical protein
MSSSLEAEIRLALIRYLTNASSLLDFQDWFVPATLNIHKSGDFVAAELAAQTELALAEYSNGHRTESDLRRELQTMVYSAKGSAITASATYNSATEFQNVAVGIEFVTAY